MKLSFHGLGLISVILAGILVAICVSPLFEDSKQVVAESDTARVETLVNYGKLELQANTIKLDLPKIGKLPQVVFVPEEKTTVVVKDSVSYIMMDREFFYTETEDAKIWHSGVSSTIDSLVVTKRTERVTTSYKQPDFKHSLSFSGSIGYNGINQYLPVEVEYLYHPQRWVGIGAKAQYDVYTKNVYVYATMKLTIRWK